MGEAWRGAGGAGRGVQSLGRLAWGQGPASAPHTVPAWVQYPLLMVQDKAGLSIHLPSAGGLRGHWIEGRRSSVCWVIHLGRGSSTAESLLWLLAL